MNVVKVNPDSIQHLTVLVERLLSQKEERRVGRIEFAHMLNIEPETLDARIRDGRYEKPNKDGRKSYWMLSYVQDVVKND
ncbi:hypothetical protein [Acinetobacter chinensis]|uniref:hypothetical protein n=1 Tax=Acinetobacter chinensis TaxID=2004650 RepID=UPI00293418D9|nr:hypothetical protein [Acinetobacter chinensis]WOE40677.1 hypothetical protein QSG87_12385 [Acinetobacter chinensis]